jgi:membrane fusion protein, multidrug efflux system
LPRILTIILGAIALVGAVIGIRWLMPSGDQIATVRAETIPTLDKPVPGAQQVRDGMQVVVRRSVAEVRPLFVSLSGRTEAARIVTVKAESSGTISQAPAEEGKIVEKGALLCGLDMQGRNARVREAEAEHSQKQQAYKQAEDLVAKGWATPQRVEQARAQLEQAQASLDVARSEFNKTQMRAPFKGVFEKRMAGVGEFLGPGGSCGTVVELDPVVVIADAPERLAAQIKADANARLRLSDGAEAQGRVRYIAKTADQTTRSFRVEVEIANPKNSIPVGRVAEIRVQVGKGDAHKVNPALLTLDGQGRIGVRYLDVGGVVSFAPADIVDEAADGTWIAGLPREALIVAEGQETVKPGLRAVPDVLEDEPAPARQGANGGQ